MEGYGFDSLCTIFKVIQQSINIVNKYARNKYVNQIYTIVTGGRR